MVREIPLTRDKVAIVDNEDYDLVAQHRWYLHSGGYAVRNSPRRKGENRHIIYMHREILSVATNMEVDHINHNRLDQRRCNLRITTHSENMCNRLGSTSKSCTGVRNVSFFKQTGRYLVQLRVAGKYLYGGYYLTLEQASLVAEELRLNYMGEYGCQSQV